MIFNNKAKKISPYNNFKELKYSEKGNGQAIVLLHGLFGNLSNWSETIEHFSKSYRVITPILPIYEGAWQGDALEDLVDYVHAIITKLNIEKATFVGNSLGGHVATLYTLAHPEVVEHLVLIGSAGLFESNMGVSYPKKGNYEYIADKVKYTFHENHKVSEELIQEVYDTVNDFKRSLSILKIAKATNRNNVSDKLGAIKTPALLIWGKDDKITPVEVALQFKEKLGGKVELHLIDQCGHAPMMEQPGEFNAILDNYLKEFPGNHSFYQREEVLKSA